MKKHWKKLNVHFWRKKKLTLCCTILVGTSYRFIVECFCSTVVLTLAVLLNLWDVGHANTRNEEHDNVASSTKTSTTNSRCSVVLVAAEASQYS